MAGFGAGRSFSSENSCKPTSIKNATVSDIKASPERGKKRIIAREKSACARAVAIDIPMKEARAIERKETYAFNVAEKELDRYGRPEGRKKAGFQTYYCDEAPEKYGGGGGEKHRDFSGGNRIKTSSRLKFT